jgi:F0F1-type ATP synthase membrane subunit c/vacuolar-type H+-ATPase subunit K
VKTIRILSLVAVLSLGLSAFVPTAFGCGGVGGSGCKQAADSPISWTFGLRVIVSTLDALMP